jgi:O-acetyl-ADP-ribose deacetylase (regulator of RNase III)
MIRLGQGNLLEAKVEAVVNTVNTVGIMGKGIALMFKERFPANFDAYVHGWKNGELEIGRMFVTRNEEFFGPRWIINFPTKTEWRANSRLEWIEDGLTDLVRTIEEKKIRSIAIPPLGCGNGGLDWDDVRPLIVAAIDGIEDLEAVIYEPTRDYQNVAKRRGVEKLTPARALVAEMVRRYCLIGIDCSILEVQKLAWFLQRGCKAVTARDPFKFDFKADKYGPYSNRLRMLLDSLDGSYLRCDRRLADARPRDLIWFNEAKKDLVADYVRFGEGSGFTGVLEWASVIIDGFESPLGMELLATVDWLMQEEGVQPTVAAILDGLRNWPGGAKAAERKVRILDKRLIDIALHQLSSRSGERSSA